MVEKDLVAIRTQVAQMTIVADYLERLKCDARFIGDKVLIPIETLAFIIVDGQRVKK